MEIIFEVKELVRINVFGSIRNYEGIDNLLSEKVPSFILSTQRLGFKVRESFELTKFEFDQPLDSNLCGLYAIEFCYLVTAKISRKHVIQADTAQLLRDALLKPMLQIFNKKECNLSQVFSKNDRSLVIKPTYFYLAINVLVGKDAKHKHMIDQKRSPLTDAAFLIHKNLLTS